MERTGTLLLLMLVVLLGNSSIHAEEHCNSYDFAKLVCVKPLCYLNCKIFFQKHLRSYSCEGTWPERKCVCYACYDN
uniref:Knottin scorpion toxin-like domain-containing protein n=1 Tax=Oryza punctata TaxID=4537 RepID=A0A0E0M6M9_ORYPU